MEHLNIHEIAGSMDHISESCDILDKNISKFRESTRDQLNNILVRVSLLNCINIIRSSEIKFKEFRRNKHDSFFQVMAVFEITHINLIPDLYILCSTYGEWCYSQSQAFTILSLASTIPLSKFSDIDPTDCKNNVKQNMDWFLDVNIMLKDLLNNIINKYLLFISNTLSNPSKELLSKHDEFIKSHMKESIQSKIDSFLLFPKEMVENVVESIYTDICVKKIHRI